MRRPLCLLAALLMFFAAWPAVAGDGKILKVLPQFLDLEGRNSLSPSLYERDAYQSQLAKHPEQRSALRFAVQWKGRALDWEKVKVRIEIRCVMNNTQNSRTLEAPARRKGWFSYWTDVTLKGDDYAQLGELVAWRATLWNGGQMIGEQKSFLW